MYQIRRVVMCVQRRNATEKEKSMINMSVKGFVQGAVGRVMMNAIKRVVSAAIMTINTIEINGDTIALKMPGCVLTVPNVPQKPGGCFVSGALKNARQIIG